MTIANKKYFCYEIYKNLSIWSFNGQLGYNPCSFFDGYIKTTDKFELGQIWNGPEHTQLKHCVENDIPIAGCRTCYRAEAQGLESRRQGSKKLYEQYHKDTLLDQDGPTSIDYSVGNLCNLKCVICGPRNSSQWVADYKKLNPEKSIDLWKYDKYNQIEIQDPDTLKNIRSVHFHGGGEPLLSDSHIRLLKNIQEVKGLQDVRVFYNTNATQTVSDEILDLWAKCKLIELYFSIDDVGPRFDYQRTGASWPQVQDNLQWYYERMPHNHMLNINCVWGYLNLFYLDDLVDWHKNSFSTNRYGDPTNLIFQQAIGPYAIKHVSNDTLDMCREKFADYPKLLQLIDTLQISDAPHDKFWSMITKLDQIRNSDFTKLCPEWSDLLK
jgi:hypothetical protein